MKKCTGTATTLQALETVLEAVTLGQVGIVGVDKYRLPEALDNVVVNLDGPPDGSVVIGTRINCSRGVSAEVEMVGKKVYDGHVFYTIRFHYNG